jgi:hypothetical protein
MQFSVIGWIDNVPRGYQVMQFISFYERKKGCIWSSSNPSGKHPATKMVFGRPDLYYQIQGMKRIPMKR